MIGHMGRGVTGICTVHECKMYVYMIAAITTVLTRFHWHKLIVNNILWGLMVLPNTGEIKNREREQRLSWVTKLQNNIFNSTFLWDPSKNISNARTEKITPQKPESLSRCLADSLQLNDCDRDCVQKLGRSGFILGIKLTSQPSHTRNNNFITFVNPAALPYN